MLQNACLVVFQSVLFYVMDPIVMSVECGQFGFCRTVEIPSTGTFLAWFCTTAEGRHWLMCR